MTADTNTAAQPGRSSALVIAHVASYYIPGLGYQENFLPFEQAALGHKVHIVTGDRLAPHPSYETVYAPRVGPRLVGQGEQVERGVAIHRLRVGIELKRHNNPWIRGTVALLHQLKPDIVHLHGVTPWSSLRVIFSSAAKQYALVCDHHLCGFNLMPFTVSRRAYYSAFRRLLARPAQNRMKAWLPINEDAKRVLGNVLGIRGEGVHINRLGADIRRFKRDPMKGEGWRRLRGIPARGKLIVHAGRLEPRKALDTLISAFAAAFPRDDSAEVQLAIVGDGEGGYLDNLKKQAESLQILSRVMFLGMLPHDDLPGLFNAADAGVWPGDPSITLVEAMGCGLPVVLPNDPGTEYAANCPGATSFPNDNIPALAETMVQSAETDDARRSEIAERFAQLLGWPSIAAQSVEIYRSVLAESTRTA